MPFNEENFTQNERVIYQAVLQATKETIEEYFGMNGVQHKFDHVETIPMLKKKHDEQAVELINKNIFWQEIKKDLYKFLFRALAIVIISFILIRFGVTEWSTIIKFIGLG